MTEQPARTREEEIGALWEKVSKGGAEFLSGYLTIDGHRIAVVAFKNLSRKEGDPTPTWRLYPPKPPTAAKGDREEQLERWHK